MKVATFNINNVRKRLPNLLAWLRAEKPDIVCLRGLKSTDEEFPAEALLKAGYQRHLERSEDLERCCHSFTQQTLG